MTKHTALEEAVLKIERIPCERRYNRHQLLRNIVDDVYKAGQAYEREKNIRLCERAYPGHPLVQAIKDDF